MIETLNGIRETVNYRQNTTMRLYDNNEREDYPAHWHTAVEIIMPTENYYLVDCCDMNIKLRENDIILICPGVIHTLTAPINEDGRRIIFQPDTSTLRGIKEVEMLMSLISPLIVITPEDYPEIHKQLRDLVIEIKDEYIDYTSFSEVIIYGKFLEMLALIGRNYTDSAERSNQGHGKQDEYIEQFMQICDYISEHCTEDLTLDDIAAYSGFSKFYFTRLFKQFTNVSFYKYLNQKRIATAEALLIDPKNSVTDVALNSGFSSLSSFIRMFKLIKGCTPTEFRKIYTS